MAGVATVESGLWLRLELCRLCALWLRLEERRLCKLWLLLEQRRLCAVWLRLEQRLLCSASARLLMTCLCKCRKGGSEKYKQSCSADNSTFVHRCCPQLVSLLRILAAPLLVPLVRKCVSSVRLTCEVKNAQPP